MTPTSVLLLLHADRAIHARLRTVSSDHVRAAGGTQVHWPTPALFANIGSAPLSAKPGDSHVDQAAPYLDTVADRPEGVYCIIKVQEDTSSFVSYLPKNGSDKTRQIASGRRRIIHYYFFIKDRQFGTGNSIRIASYAPFTVTVCFNGHNFVAQQLRNHAIQFQIA
jgi:hypothetical protein